LADRVDVRDVAAALATSTGLLARHFRQIGAGELTLPERIALARLERDGRSTAARLARLEQISPQSMGATLGRLEASGLVARSNDPTDGRRVLLAVTRKGLRALHDRRSARTAQLATALQAEFTTAELEQLRVSVALLERLAARL
jgi:DNA-binding MarR family transcriptional regulator